MASSLPASTYDSANSTPGPTTVGYNPGNSSVQEVDNADREDSSEDSDVDGMDIKERLLDYLENIRAPGSFATMGRLRLRCTPASAC